MQRKALTNIERAKHERKSAKRREIQARNIELLKQKQRLSSPYSTSPMNDRSRRIFDNVPRLAPSGTLNLSVPMPQDITNDIARDPLYQQSLYKIPEVTDSDDFQNNYRPGIQETQVPINRAKLDRVSKIEIDRLKRKKLRD